MRQSYWEDAYKLTSLTAEIPNYSLRPAATTSTAQTPIPRQGDSCPTGTYKSGDYCKPFKSSEDQVIIQKSGSKCPTGFYKSGGEYCKRMSSSDREAIPRENGGKCPTGWRKPGGYCVKQ
jgi:hypothetical protein